MADEPAPLLKEMFNEARFRQVAGDVRAVYRRFDEAAFLRATLPGLEALNLLQRMRRMAEGLRATLPQDYESALGVLFALAPRMGSGFVTMVLPDFVGVYGREHFAASMKALKYFTVFGSSEFAVREFLRLDLPRSLKEMERWSRDENEHVRRLASEGCRPRLPWSFRLTELVKNPEPVAPILENLKADPSLYVRKSVANHLNDITKDHPEWVLKRMVQWDLGHCHTAWIVKRALRTLVKQGDPAALALLGVGGKAEVTVSPLSVLPGKIHLGDTLELAFAVTSTAKKPQKLVVDYTIHYVKKSGSASAKVFKLKEMVLNPGESVTIRKQQTVKNFTTRVHHAGRHMVEVMINGEVLAQGVFLLEVDRITS